MYWDVVRCEMSTQTSTSRLPTWTASRREYDIERAVLPDHGGLVSVAQLLRDCMRVVITGASGFLGRAALAHFRNAGIEAVGVHRQPTTAPGEVTVKDYAQAPAGDVLIHLAENGDRTKVAQLGPRFVSEVQ